MSQYVLPEERPVNPSQLNNVVFQQIADDLRSTGRSVIDNALPNDLLEGLYSTFFQLDSNDLHQAKIGRQETEQTRKAVRSDKISWIEGDRPATQAWLKWAEDLQVYLNRQLLLGLFSFESHLAIYQQGAFYKRHLDAFKGQANRVLTLVAYFNKEWQKPHGGELVIYEDENDVQGQLVEPVFGRLVVFLSEEFPHEVLPTTVDRYSIAGWFRLNESVNGVIAPPN